jgi:Zn-dependent peptidase ImmA (M78 family)
MRCFPERGGQEFPNHEANKEREADQELQTIEDLGKLVKEKYPHYRSMSDAEVGRHIRNKFTPAYDDFVDKEALEKPGTIYDQ